VKITITYKIENWEYEDGYGVNHSIYNDNFAITHRIYDGTYYIFCDNDTIYSSSDGNSWATTYSLAGNHANYGAAFRKHTDGYVYFVYGYDDAGTDKIAFIKSNDGFANVTVIQTITPTGSYSNVESVHDLFYDGSTWWCLCNLYVNIAGQRCGFLDLSTPDQVQDFYYEHNPFAEGSVGLSNIAEYDGKQYFLKQGDSVNMTLFSFDGSTFTSEKTWAETDFVVDGSFFIRENHCSLFVKGSSLILIIADTTYGYAIHKVSLLDFDAKVIRSDFSNLTDGSGDPYSSILSSPTDNRDVTEFFMQNTEFAGTDEYLNSVIFKNNGKWFRRLINIVNTDDPPTITLNNKIFTHDNKFELVIAEQKLAIMDAASTTYYNFLPMNIAFYSDQLKGNKLSFEMPEEDNIVFQRGEYIKIYSDTDQLIEGIYNIELTETSENKYVIICGTQNDLDTEVSVSFAGKSHEMLQYLIDNYCDFIEGTIADDSFADWIYVANNKKISKIINEIMNYDYHLFKIEKDNGASFIDNPLNGAASLTLNYDNCSEPTIKNKSYALTKVILSGKWLGTSYDEAIWDSEVVDIPSINVLFDAYPKLDSIELQKMANSIGDQLKNQVQIITMDIYDDAGLYEYGDIVELSYAIKGIGTDSPAFTPSTYEKFMITRFAMNAFGGIHIELISAFVFTRGREADRDPLKVAKLADIANERVIQLGTSLQKGDITFDKLQVTGNPTDSDGVGNRDYNDARYQGISTQSAIMRNKSTSQSIAKGATPVITYTTSIYDKNSDWDSVNNRFDVPEDNTYLVTASVLINKINYTQGTSIALAIYINGTLNKYLLRFLAAGGFEHAHLRGTAEVYAEDGDYIDIRLYNGYSASISTLATNTAYSYLSIRKVF